MTSIYKDGTYLNNNPSWHQEGSAWKAKNIKTILEKNSLNPKTICEVGCGAGEILNKLLENLDGEKKFFGYEISPQAFELCSKKTKDKLSFALKDLLEEGDDIHFDVVMAIDVFEHVEEYFSFLRKFKTKGDYKIFHIPLDLSVQSILRSSPILHSRRAVGHINYFTKDLAIETLKDTGYDIIDYFYTAGAMEIYSGWKTKLLNIPRKLMFAINKDFAVRFLGGYSLLVLAK